jgi:hypothetical protein
MSRPSGLFLTVLLRERHEQARNTAADVVEGDPAQRVGRIDRCRAQLLQHPLHRSRMSAKEGQQGCSPDHQAPRRGHRAEAQPPNPGRVEQAHLAGHPHGRDHHHDHLAAVVTHPVRLELTLSDHDQNVGGVSFDPDRLPARIAPLLHVRQKLLVILGY